MSLFMDENDSKLFIAAANHAYVVQQIRAEHLASSGRSLTDKQLKKDSRWQGAAQAVGVARDPVDYWGMARPRSRKIINAGEVFGNNCWKFSPQDMPHSQAIERSFETARLQYLMDATKPSHMEQRGAYRHHSGRAGFALKNYVRELGFETLEEIQAELAQHGETFSHQAPVPLSRPIEQEASELQIFYRAAFAKHTKEALRFLSRDYPHPALTRRYYIVPRAEVALFDTIREKASGIADIEQMAEIGHRAVADAKREARRIYEEVTGVAVPEKLSFAARQTQKTAQKTNREI